MALWGEPAPATASTRWFDLPGHPRLLARQLNPNVTVINWADDRLMIRDGVLPGRIIDLAHLGQALAGHSEPTFADMCVIFGVPDPGPAPDPAVLPGPTVLPDLAAATTSAMSPLLDWLETRLAAEVALYDAMAVECDRWRDCGASKLRPPWLYSGGGLANQVFQSAGYTPPSTKAELSPETAGAFTGAFFGGRTEASLLRLPVPAVCLDFSSNYVSCAALLGVGDLFSAERIDTEDVTVDLAGWLAELEASDDPVTTLLDPAMWRRWGATVAMVEPAGEWLPYRALTGHAEVSIGFGPLRSPTPLPYFWADLASAVVKGGRAPKVLSAWRLVPEGRMETHRVVVPGTTVDLGCTTAAEANDGDEIECGGDVFVALLQARTELRALGGHGDPLARRREAAIKRMGNAAAFGNLSRFDREPASSNDEPPVIVDPWGATFTPRLRWVEDPARWTFPAAASAVTAGSRLVVALGERVVTDAGGTVAAVHTDSLMIPASPQGGLWSCPGGPAVNGNGESAIKLLSWSQLDEMFACFDTLRLDGGRAWKPEHDTRRRTLYVTIYGTNRYVVHDPKTGEVVHGAESHLGGTMLDPSDQAEALLPDGRRAWVASLHEAMVNKTQLPPWTARPAVSVWRATNRTQLRWLRHHMSEAQPFTSFLLAHPGPASKLATTMPRSGRGEHEPSGSPIASFDPDPASWAELSWRRRDGTPVRFMLPDDPAVRASYYLGAGAFEAATIRETVARWRSGGDFGAVPAAGGAEAEHPASFAGLYRRLPAEAVPGPALIGREGDKLVEADRGILTDPAERLTVVAEPGSYIDNVQAVAVRDLLTQLRYFPGELAKLAAEADLPARTLRAFLAGRGLQPAGARRLLGALDRVVLDQLLAAKVSTELIGESPRAVRYELVRRLLGGGAVVARGRVADRCGLPGCEKPRRRTYLYCCRDHERAAADLVSASCEYPWCSEPPRSGGRFCCERHRGAMADRRRRAQLRGESEAERPEPVLIEPHERRGGRPRGSSVEKDGEDANAAEPTDRTDEREASR